MFDRVRLWILTKNVNIVFSVMEKAHLRRTRLIISITFIALFIGLAIFAKNAITTRTIVSVDLPENKRFRVVQTFGGEPFDTKLYFDSGDGQWGFYYYEHEDWYWNSAETKIEGDIVSVMRNGNWTIRFNSSNGTCEVKRRDGWYKVSDRPAYYTDSLPGPKVPIGI